MPQDSLGLLHVIIGLPGSGKSTRISSLVAQIAAAYNADDYHGGAIGDRSQPQWSRHMLPAFDALRQGLPVVASDIAFCDSERFEQFRALFVGHLPELTVVVSYFQNDPERCKRNVAIRARTDDRAQSVGPARWELELAEIDRWAARYSPPEDAQPVPAAIGPVSNRGSALLRGG